MLQLLANDCYRAGAFLYAAKAFDTLERLDPNPEYWDGKRGACVGAFQKASACPPPPPSHLPPASPCCPALPAPAAPRVPSCLRLLPPSPAFSRPSRASPCPSRARSRLPPWRR